MAENFKTFDLRRDNYADGKLSDALLDSVNPGVLSLLSCCMYYEGVLQKCISEGKGWVYTNSNQWAPQKGPFDCILYSGKLGVNCAMPANWALMDMGVMSTDMRFYGDRDCGFHGLDQVGACISECADIIDCTADPKPFSAMNEAGNVKPGDIFLACGHTFIYLGDNLFFAAGHDGKWHAVDLDPFPSEDQRKSIFDSWVCPVETCGNNRCTVYWQIRMKDSYIPRFFRNKEGKLVYNSACAK